MTFRARKASPRVQPILLLWAFVLLFATALTAPAFAQIGQTIDLRDTDIAMAAAAAAKLYENLDTPVGATESWANPQTGASGTVTLIARMEPNGMTCRRLHHVIRVRSQGDPFNFMFDRCLVGGVWRTYP